MMPWWRVKIPAATVQPEKGKDVFQMQLEKVCILCILKA
jgi:hypothetical protein